MRQFAAAAGAATYLEDEVRAENINYYPVYKDLRTTYEELEKAAGTGEHHSKAIVAYEELVEHNPYNHQYWIELIHL